MKRWHQDAIRSKNKEKLFWTQFDHIPLSLQYRYGQIGRFRKRNSFGCTRTRCGICKSHKYPKRELTRREIESKLFFNERLFDLDA